MAKFIKVKSNAYREILVNKEHILFFRKSQDARAAVKKLHPELKGELYNKLVRNVAEQLINGGKDNDRARVQRSPARNQREG